MCHHPQDDLPHPFIILLIHLALDANWCVVYDLEAALYISPLEFAAK
jgi:hypothetical protein